MKCKNCGAELKEGCQFCPDCGEPLEDAPESFDAGIPEESADAAEHCAADESFAVSVSDESAEAGSPPVKSKKHGMNGAVAVILAAAVFLTVCAGLFFALRGGEKEESDGQTAGDIINEDAPSDSSSGDGTSAALVDDAPLPALKTVVATMGTHELDNEAFLFYYWDEFYYIYNQYGTSITSVVDPTKSFATQEYNTGVSWRDYLTEQALSTWAQTMVLCDEAKAAKFALDADDQAEMDGIPEQLKGYATNSGYTDAESYLRASYDDAVTMDGFMAYLSNTYLASGYVNAQYDVFMKNHLDLAGQEKYNVQVRHILIAPADTTDTSKANAKAEAERVYALWQQNPTEDNFAALAKEYSTDGGSNSNGGLYDNVTPGQMVDSFNDWCFDASRKIGDNAIVESKFGYHIMYFAGYSDTAYESAQGTAASADYEAWLNPLLENGVYTRTSNEIGFSR